MGEKNKENIVHASPCSSCSCSSSFAPSQSQSQFSARNTSVVFYSELY